MFRVRDVVCLSGRQRSAFGERLRVVVQLVNVALETPIWAEKFDCKFTDIFELQDEITLRVVGALPLQLSADE